ncbi:MAG: metalloregulator ArsR/SmtB family transcription factor [Granulosicoccus sp.]
MEMVELQENANKAGQLLSVMSNPSRLLVLCYLCGDGEKSVQQMQMQLGIGQSALSQHLAILRREKLVNTRRQAQTIYYSLASEDAKAIMSTLCNIYGDKP